MGIVTNCTAANAAMMPSDLILRMTDSCDHKMRRRPGTIRARLRSFVSSPRWNIKNLYTLIASTSHVPWCLWSHLADGRLDFRAGTGRKSVIPVTLARKLLHVLVVIQTISIARIKTLG